MRGDGILREKRVSIVREENKAMLRAALFAVVMTGALYGARSHAAEAFPARPVRMVVPYAPGGSVDALARVLAKQLSDIVGQQVVVDNRPGASGNIGTEIVVRAPADGYTILMTTLPLVLNPSLYSKLPFDVTTDLAPISLIGAAPFILVVHPSVSARSVQELIALAKKEPGKLNYPSGGNGTNSHVAAELFKSLTGTNIVHVPYKGGGPAVIGTVSGEVSLAFLGFDVVLPHVKAGRLRALAITSARRSKLVPDLPTVAESGVPGYQFSSWYGVLAPARTPEEIIMTINHALGRAMRSSDLAERLERDGTDVIVSTPAEFRAHIKSELARWVAVVKQAGIRAD
jgi:tripartite-type tricarboxylate transporter receptor subunit TctC